MKPPSYRIIRRAYADGSEDFRVRVSGGDAWLWCVWLDWSKMFGRWEPLPSPKRFKSREYAQSACREHWQQWLSQHQLFTEEIHFDPEADTCTG